MFHWICPECGREIPPAVKECPACDPQTAASQPSTPAYEPHQAHEPQSSLKPLEQKPQERQPQEHRPRGIDALPRALPLVNGAAGPAGRVGPDVVPPGLETREVPEPDPAEPPSAAGEVYSIQQDGDGSTASAEISAAPAAPLAAVALLDPPSALPLAHPVDHSVPPPLPAVDGDSRNGSSPDPANHVVPVLSAQSVAPEPPAEPSQSALTVQEPEPEPGRTVESHDLVAQLEEVRPTEQTYELAGPPDQPQPDVTQPDVTQPDGPKLAEPPAPAELVRLVVPAPAVPTPVEPAMLVAPMQAESIPVPPRPVDLIQAQIKAQEEPAPPMAALVGLPASGRTARETAASIASIPSRAPAAIEPIEQVWESEPARLPAVPGEPALRSAPRVDLPDLGSAVGSQAFGVTLSPVRVPAPVPEPTEWFAICVPAVDLPKPALRPASRSFRISAGPALQAQGWERSLKGGAPTELPTQTGNIVPPELRPVVAPMTAGLVDYSTAASRSMRPAQPRRGWVVPAAEPRITLPGPALPRSLNSLAEAGLRTVLERPRSVHRRRPGASLMWIVLAAVIFAAVAFYTVPPLLLNAKSSAVEADASPNAARPVGTYPLSKTIEVTGFRFVLDLNGKSEIHYLVVNHSAAQFGGVTVYVTLHGADPRPGQPPVARFSFRAPDMGPYSSREMTSPIERISRPVTLPDWQDMHAEVEIAE